MIEVYDRTLWEYEDLLYVSNILVGASLEEEYNGHHLADNLDLGVITAFCPSTEKHDICQPFISAGNYEFYKRGNTDHPGWRL
jgi:hypothetical protein